MIDKVFEFLESFEELDGIEHILAMHILCETSLKVFFEKHNFGENAYVLCEKSNFDFYTIKKALTLHYPEKLSHVEEGLDLLLRLFNLNIFANHENNPSIGDLRLEFPWLHEEYSKKAGFDKSEILKIYNEAKLSKNKLNSIELPSCYKKNVTACKNSRVLPRSASPPEGVFQPLPARKRQIRGKMVNKSQLSGQVALEVKTWSSMDLPFPKEMMGEDPLFPGEEVFIVGDDDLPCDHQLATWKPDDSNNVGFELVMVIGPVEGNEMERFTTFIRTQKNLASIDNMSIGPKEIVIEKFDWTETKKNITLMVDNCARETWKKSEKKLQKLFYFDGEGVWY